MWHRVAALLGGRSVEEWKRAMSSAEFVEWCAFYAIEPWGFEAENWRMGLQAAVTANYSGRVKKPLKVSDFLPKPDPPRKAVDPAKLRERLSRDIEKAQGNG